MMILQFLRICSGDYSDHVIETLTSSLSLVNQETLSLWVSGVEVDEIPLIDVIQKDESGGASLFREIIKLSVSKKKPSALVMHYFDRFASATFKGFVSETIGTQAAMDCIDSIRLFEELQGFHIPSMIEWITNLNTQDTITNSDEIKVMTYHVAKGLESKAVILPWIEDTIFPRDPFDQKSVQDALRLFYVGVTRTQSALIVMQSGDTIFNRGNKWK